MILFKFILRYQILKFSNIIKISLECNEISIMIIFFYDLIENVILAIEIPINILVCHFN